MTSLPRFHYHLSQSDEHDDIEPFFSVTEEEVRTNKKNLMMELEWMSCFNKYAQHDYTYGHYVSARRNMYMPLHPIDRLGWIRSVRTSLNKLILIGHQHTLNPYAYVQRILQCNEYVATLPLPRFEKVVFKRRKPIKRKSWLDKCFSCLGIYDDRPFFLNTQVCVNLQTKEVVLYWYYH